MYIGQWINKIEQFGYVLITFLAEDDEGLLPSYRVDKSYKDDIFSDELLQQEYDLEIQKAIDFSVAIPIIESDK